MKQTLLILTLLALTSCGWFGQKKQAVYMAMTAENRETAIGEMAQPDRDAYKHYTVEDTVRLQIGGKLYDLEIGPDDSITVFHSRHWQPEEGELYREYGFIVHDRYTRSHSQYEPLALDAEYKSWSEYDSGVRLDSLMRTEFIGSAVVDFNGYWIPLTERDGDYYFDDYMAPLGSFLLADSVITSLYMDGLYPRKIWKATVSPDGSLSIMFDKETEMKLESIDREREIYRGVSDDGFGEGYFIPARAIHNVELIQWANTTGDLI